MVKPFFLPLLILFIVLGASPASANEPWLHGQVVELQALDKIAARTATIEAEVGKPLKYGTLEILVHACVYRPPSVAPENAVLLVVTALESEATIFSGWMFGSSPAVNALEHPVYDLSVLVCKKA